MRMRVHVTGNIACNWFYHGWLEITHDERRCSDAERYSLNVLFLLSDSIQTKYYQKSSNSYFRSGKNLHLKKPTEATCGHILLFTSLRRIYVPVWYFFQTVCLRFCLFDRIISTFNENSSSKQAIYGLSHYERTLNDEGCNYEPATPSWHW